MRKTTIGRVRLQEVVKCALYHSRGETNTNIAKILDISSAMVRQNLKIAREEGILRDEVYPSPEVEVAEAIKEKYGLGEVYVFPTYAAEKSLEMLARLSAAYVEKRLDDREGGIFLFNVNTNYEDDLSSNVVPGEIRQEFESIHVSLSEGAVVSIDEVDSKDNAVRWLITDGGREYVVKKADKDMMNVYRKIRRVAVGPGKMMLAFAKAISNIVRPNMKVGSTAIATSRETFIASNILIGILAGKWECELYRFGFRISLDSRRDYAEMIVMGIERVDADGDTALVLSLETGIGKSMLEQDFSSLRARLGAGFINYQAIDIYGRPLGWGMDFYDRVFGDNLLKLNDIRDMAMDKEKQVVCISTGREDAKAIQAGLLGKYFNVLITDYQTAIAILSYPQKSI